MKMVIHQKKHQNNIFICFKMQAERSSLCRLQHHIKLIIFITPLSTSYKSIRRPSPPNFSSQFVFRGTKFSTKLASVTLNWGQFLDSKLFLEIMKKLGKVYNSHEYHIYKS